ncbi:hypothetical protein B0H12DRAFT_1095649 [Mycena haematopus]|nr:hypothetical protein B0H12DRAFT_1095649 [Mycena haematopus]
MRRGARRLLAQPVRWSSTVESLPKPSKESVNHPTPLDGSPAPRRFPRLRVDDGTPYAPNLGDIAANAAQGTLSARLAAARLAAENPAQESMLPNTATAVLHELGAARRVETDTGTAVGVSLPRPFPTPQVSQEKIDELVSARREERLARETGGLFPVGTNTFRQPSTPISFAPPPGPSPADSEAAIDEGVRRRHELLAARRAERLARQAQEAASKNRVPQPRAPNLNVTKTSNFGATSEIGQSTPSGMGRGFVARGGRAPSAPQIGRGGTSTRGGTRGGRGRGRGEGGGVGVRRRRNDDDRKPENDDEFTAEVDDWLESDDVHLATALAPELPTRSLYRELHPQTSDRKPADRKALRESLGGDYSRFVPQNPQLFIASARKIGPVNHSSVVLAHAKGVLENRSHAHEVIAKVA